MKWYYAVGTKRTGPFTEIEIEQLVKEGKITDDTLVWNEAIIRWQPYGKVKAGNISAPAGDPPAQNESPAASQENTGARFSGSANNEQKTASCVECGKVFPEEDMIRYGSSMICQTCKPLFFQKLREGADMPDAVKYAGFWIRFGAKFIDGMITGLMNAVISLVVFLLAGVNYLALNPLREDFGEFFIAQIIASTLEVIAHAAYNTFFIGKYAATPGKMACGIKVIMPEGGRISYLRALGRHFAEMLSAIILMIGYIMAAFDDEKRALHDRICNTRVIRK